MNIRSTYNAMYDEGDEANINKTDDGKVELEIFADGVSNIAEFDSKEDLLAWVTEEM